jgi:monoamine oxidase
LAELKADLPIADFLKEHFAGPEYARLRRSIERMAEGYDAADPARASAFALRDEWMNEGPGNQGRIAGGYGALIDFLAAECRKLGAVIDLNAVVKAIEIAAGSVVIRCANGAAHAGTAAILTVPLPILDEIELPPAIRKKAGAAADIGFGNVIKILLRFKTRWWADRRREFADLSFLITDREIPVWWTQSPLADPVLTGWFGGPKTRAMSGYNEDQLIETGLVSLGHVFAVSPGQLKDDLVAARAIDWANEAFARGAYSYATPATREAQSKLASADASPVLFSGEALYRGRDMGTVEAALASGLETARALLAASVAARS